MSDQQIRDRNGRLIGRIKVLGNGKFEGRDTNGRLKGTYDPKADKTRDATGRLVGSGNQLASLLHAD